MELKLSFLSSANSGYLVSCAADKTFVIWKLDHSKLVIINSFYYYYFIFLSFYFFLYYVFLSFKNILNPLVFCNTVIKFIFFFWVFKSCFHHHSISSLFQRLTDFFHDNITNYNLWTSLLWSSTQGVQDH